LHHALLKAVRYMQGPIRKVGQSFKRKSVWAKPVSWPGRHLRRIRSSRCGTPLGRRPSFSVHGRPPREFPGPSKAVCARVLEIVFDFLRRLPLLLAHDFDLQRSVSPSDFGGQGAGKRILQLY